jgi:hypothetical protein
MIDWLRDLPSQPLRLGLPVSENNPPAAGRPAVRPFYSNFDWLNYGLILLVNQCHTCRNPISFVHNEKTGTLEILYLKT